MTSYRKKDASHIPNPAPDDGAVTSTPQAAAAQPPVAEAPKTAEQPAPEPNPVEAAAQSALRDRLREVERADVIARSSATQPPRPDPRHEPPQQQSIPAHVEEWLSRHPQFLDPNDAIAQTEIGLATMKAQRDGKTWHDADFLPTLERYLGLAPATNGYAQSNIPHESNITKPPENRQPINAPTPSRHTTPVRQQQYAGPSVSAPPTREAPSMSTGRAPQTRTTLTPDEKEIAWVSRSRADMTPQEAFEEYALNKLKLQNDGLIGPGARDGR